MAREQNIDASHHWFLGEDKFLDWTIFQADGVTPQNITGWALEWTLRRTIAEADPPVLTKSTASGITITGGAQGQLRVTILDTDTNTLPARVYQYALKRTEDGSETVLAFGKADIRQAVIR